jgi:transposase
MSVNKYDVNLTDSERLDLVKLISTGRATAKSIMHANVLLATDSGLGHGKSERDIAAHFHVSMQTVHNIRKAYAECGLAVALGRKKRETPPVPPKITGDVEARIIAIGCSSPPEGRARWSVRMIADRTVELEILDTISYESVRRVLKKTSSSRT